MIKLRCPRCTGEMILKAGWYKLDGRLFPPGWICTLCMIGMSLTRVFDASQAEIDTAKIETIKKEPR